MAKERVHFQVLAVSNERYAIAVAVKDLATDRAMQSCITNHDVHDESLLLDFAIYQRC
jgi:hypothetical protein